MQPDDVREMSVRFFPKWAVNNPDQVIGLLQLTNAVLKRNPTGGRWVEIGSHIGESATLFLGFPQITHLDCIEAFHKRTEFLTDKLKRQIKLGRLSIHTARSANFAAFLADESVDMVYVDGDHEYAGVAEDIRLYWPKIKLNGFMGGHDYAPPHPGVQRAVDELIATGKTGPFRQFADASWLVQKLAN